MLTERDREIFGILIADYIATACPVGSSAIARQYPGHISPATIRNVMADLTSMGLLAQPHTSAGRLPTDAGLRFYVDSLLKRRDLSDSEMGAIREKCLGDEQGIDKVLQRASKILALVSHYVGIVVMPSAKRIVFKHVEFVALSNRRILGVFVSQEGRVENRLIEVGEDLSYPELEKIANYCNQFFVGLSLEDSLEKITRELETERADYDRLLKKAMLFSRELLNEASRSDISVDGESQLLGEPEFSETDRFKNIMDAIEEKSAILNLLEKCKGSEGVQIFIGSDANINGEKAISLVGTPYYKDGKIVGTLGVIGPRHMDYSRIVPIVDFTAKVIGDALEI